MTELILIRPAPGQAWITDFWDQVHYRWPADILATQSDGLRVASAAAVRNYRAHHDYIGATSTHACAATEPSAMPADQANEWHGPHFA